MRSALTNRVRQAWRSAVTTRVGQKRTERGSAIKQSREAQHENNEAGDLPRQASLAIPQGPYRRGPGGTWRAHPGGPGEDLRPGRGRTGAVPDRQGSDPGGPPLAGHVPSRLLPGRSDPDQCAEWGRAGAMGPGGQGPGRPGVPDAGRSDAGPDPAVQGRRRPGNDQGLDRAGFHLLQDRPVYGASVPDHREQGLHRHGRQPFRPAPRSRRLGNRSCHRLSRRGQSPDGEAAHQGTRTLPALLRGRARPVPERRRARRDRPGHAPAHRHG